jgi:hypothetical protein
VNFGGNWTIWARARKIYTQLGVRTCAAPGARNLIDSPEMASYAQRQVAGGDDVALLCCRHPRG